jgi:F-type H+-transporting ATPase subunit delta
MVNVSIARRYARALIDAAGANSDTVLNQLTGFVQLTEENRELGDLLVNPAFTRAQRQGVIEAIIAQSGMDASLANLLRLLVDRQRFQYLPDIARLYRDQADARAGRLRGKVTSAVPLSPEALQKLEHSLERMTQRNVVLEAKVDPSIIGGASAQVGSVVYDGTLRSQLQDIKRQLTSR